MGTSARAGIFARRPGSVKIIGPSGRKRASGALTPSQASSHIESSYKVRSDRPGVSGPPPGKTKSPAPEASTARARPTAAVAGREPGGPGSSGGFRGLVMVFARWGGRRLRGRWEVALSAPGW